MLECLMEEGPKVLSPACAAALTSVIQANVYIAVDGGIGGACWYEAAPGLVSPAASGRAFCSAIGGCVGGAAYCERAICMGCGADDARYLASDGGPFEADFFGGLCPPVNPASPCADLECLIDAGPKVLSPDCASALAALVQGFPDSGLDGG